MQNVIFVVVPITPYNLLENECLCATFTLQLLPQRYVF